jgi:hypothetical protein
MKDVKMDEPCGVHRRGENAYNVLFWRTEEKTPLGKSRHRWENNIEMDLKEVGWKNVDWIHLSQDGTNSGIIVNQ